jgi:hypothetical protein
VFESARNSQYPVRECDGLVTVWITSKKGPAVIFKRDQSHRKGASTLLPELSLDDK